MCVCVCVKYKLQAVDSILIKCIIFLVVDMDEGSPSSLHDQYNEDSDDEHMSFVAVALGLP